MTTGTDHSASATASVVHAVVRDCAERAARGAASLVNAPESTIGAALRGMAERVRSARTALIVANEADLALAQAGGMSEALQDRLRLTDDPRAVVRADAPVAGKVAIARDAAINDRLAAIPPSERASFHATLWSIVEGTAAQT